MHQFKLFKFVLPNIFQQAGLLIVTLLALLSAATPALAHHPMGGRMPANFLEGFLTGVAHPLIGIDHFVFIVAVGLLAATKKQGVLIPVAFVLAAMLGTGLHLTKLSIPGIELLVSGSVLLFGILLATNNSLNIAAVTGLSALAGIFHGYAYGEAIFGAEMTPLLAYLAGFTVIQLAISLAVFWLAKTIIFNQAFNQANGNQLPHKLQSAGLVICGIGFAFFASQVVNIIFPAPVA